MRKILIVAALESEFFTSPRQDQKIFYTGVGKINAARLATQLIIEEKPDLILNVGTAGCLNRESLGGVFGIRDVIERDMNAEPLAPRGTVPLGNQPSVFKSDFGTARCATGDSFVTSKDYWLVENRVDMVDMELFAVAKIAEHYGVQWRAIKFASDLADENAAEFWTGSLQNANKRISEMMEQALCF
jgi:adenosylhomocysteine nucleosidase